MSFQIEYDFYERLVERHMMGGDSIRSGRKLSFEYPVSPNIRPRMNQSRGLPKPMTPSVSIEQGQCRNRWFSSSMTNWCRVQSQTSIGYRGDDRSWTMGSDGLLFQRGPAVLRMIRELERRTEAEEAQRSRIS
jgi:hypothetical protein